MNKKITHEQYLAAMETIAIYKEQLIEERKNRVPKFGDTVDCLCGISGRYIGNGQAIYIPYSGDIIKRDLVDMEADWEVGADLPSDKELIDYIKENQWIK